MSKIVIRESDRERIVRHVSTSLLAAMMQAHPRGIPSSGADIRFDDIGRRAADILLRDYRLVPRKPRP